MAKEVWRRNGGSVPYQGIGYRDVPLQEPSSKLPFFG